jgi:hypothetical protein
MGAYNCAVAVGNRHFLRMLSTVSTRPSRSAPRCIIRRNGSTCHAETCTYTVTALGRMAERQKQPKVDSTVEDR